MSEQSGINDRIFECLSEGGRSGMAAAISAFTRDKMRYIEHVPMKYYLPGTPDGALVRLYRELEEQGRIEMHPAAWIPKCLVDEGIEPLPAVGSPGLVQTG